MKNLIIVILCFGIILMNSLITAQENIKVYGANWTPGFFEAASSVAFDGKLIYVADSNNSRIQVYDRTFKPLFWFGSYGEKNGAFIEITNVTTSQESVYVTSIDSYSGMRGRIQSFSHDGIFKLTFDKNTGRTDFLKASELSNGNVVAITEKTFCIFSNKGLLVKEYTKFNDEIFLSIKDLAVIPDYGFSIIDKNKRGFFVIDNDLKGFKSYGEEYVYLPSAIAYGNEQFFVADSGGKIYTFDRSGRFIKSLDTGIYIKSIEILDNKTLIITSLLEKGLMILNIETSEMKTIKIEPKNELELHWPDAICVDEGLIFVSDDYSGGIKIISADKGDLVEKSGIVDNVGLQVIGIAVLNKEEIYIISENDNSVIYKFNEKGFSKKFNLTENASFIGIKADETQNIYVLDRITNSIYRFSNDTIDKDFKITLKEKIDGFCIKNDIYVSIEGGKILSFDLESGELKSSIQLKNIPQSLNSLHHFTVGNESIILSHRFGHKLYTFSLKDGSFISEIGGIGGPKTYSSQSNIQVDMAFEPAKFLFPEEIFFKNGIVYVADSGNHRIQAIPESYFLIEEIVIELKIGSKIARISGKEFSLDAAPFIENRRTLVPVRFIAEGFGANVSWDGKERKVRINDKGTIMELWVDKNSASINNKEYILDVPPRIVSGRTFVPIRFIAEGFGANVSWDDKDQTVTIRRRSSLSQ